MYRVEYSPLALRALRRLPLTIHARILQKINLLAQDPFAKNNNATKLKGKDGYRLRIGDWRVIYDIVQDRLIVVIISVGPRGSIYE